MNAQFFATPAAFRAWLEKNAATAKELLVGYYKTDSGLASMSWPDSVDEALCFGWIDGVRKRIDEQAYCIRFTPRKPNSIWSAVNIAKYEKLLARDKITPAGVLAYSHRRDGRSKIYAYEQDVIADFAEPERKQFQQHESAWAFFQATPPSYQLRVLHWLNSAKKAETRAVRLVKLIQASAGKTRL